MTQIISIEKRLRYDIIISAFRWRIFDRENRIAIKSALLISRFLKEN